MFVKSLETNKLQFNDWILGRNHAYPAHGILRRLACVYAFLGRTSDVQQSLSRLNNVVEDNPHPIFQLIEIAANIQCAGLMRERETRFAHQLLFGSGAQPGDEQRIAELMKSIG